jgi:general secretion pathway protein D
MRYARLLVCLLTVAGILAAEGLTLTDVITDQDLAEARRPQPPSRLRASQDRKDLDLRGDAKTLFGRVAHEYALEAVFDSDYQAGAPIRFQLQQANYREALRGLEAATGSFVFPLNERVFMVAKDTPQKRQELEPTMSVVIGIPQALTVQEVQELARTVQMSMQLQRLSVDPQRNMVLINDKVSKVRPALALFQELMHQRPQVSVDVELLEVSRSSLLTYGLMMPAQYTLSYLLTPQIPLSMLFRGVGTQLWGLTLGNAELMANMNESNSRSLFHAQLRSVDGQQAVLHIGDKYPILSSGYFGQTGGTGQLYVPPPTFNFEDLGLLIKLTPHINGVEDVSFDVNAEFKVLTGQSLNGIPVISSRKLDSKVRVGQGEWAVLAGLLSSTEAKTISGIAGLNSVPVLGPLLRQNTREKTDHEVLILLKPTLLSLPPSEFVTRAVRVGSESRSLIPL